MRSIDDKSPSALQAKVLEQSPSKKIAALETLFDIQPGKQQGDKNFGQYLSQFIQDSKTKKAHETSSRESQKNNRPTNTTASSKPNQPKAEKKITPQKENDHSSSKKTESACCKDSTPESQQAESPQTESKKSISQSEAVNQNTDEASTIEAEAAKVPEKTEALTAEQLLAAILSTAAPNAPSNPIGNFSADKTLLQVNASIETTSTDPTSSISTDIATEEGIANSTIFDVSTSASTQSTPQAVSEQAINTAELTAEFNLDSSIKNAGISELPKEGVSNNLLDNEATALKTGSLSELIKTGSQGDGSPIQGTLKSAQTISAPSGQSQSTDSIDFNALLASGQGSGKSTQDSNTGTQTQNSFSGIDSIEALSDNKPTANNTTLNPAINPNIKVSTESKSNAAISNQVIEGIQQAARSGDEIKLTGKKEVVMQLEPEHLGQLRITLNSNHHQEVSARIITNNRETQEVLKNQIAYLKESLEQQGVQLSKVTVIYTGNESNTDLGQFQQQLNQQNTHAFQQFQNQQQSQNHSGNGLHQGPSVQTGAQHDPAARDTSTRSPLSQQNDLGQISLLV